MTTAILVAMFLTACTLGVCLLFAHADKNAWKMRALMQREENNRLRDWYVEQLRTHAFEIERMRQALDRHRAGYAGMVTRLTEIEREAARLVS